MDDSEAFSEENEEMGVLVGFELSVLLSYWKKIFGINWVELKGELSQKSFIRVANQDRYCFLQERICQIQNTHQIQL